MPTPCRVSFILICLSRKSLVDCGEVCIAEANVQCLPSKRAAKTTSSDTPWKCKIFSVLSLLIERTLHVVNSVAVGLECRPAVELLWPEV